MTDINKRRGFDHIGVTAVAILHDGAGKIMLQKRGPKARDEHGRWDAVGGAIEFGDSITETIERELMEELGVEPIKIDFIKVYDAHREQNGQKTHWIAIAHAVQVNPKHVSIKEPHKISEIGWFGANELPAPLHSQFHKVHPTLIKEKVLR